jgi:hypothetical protein
MKLRIAAALLSLAFVTGVHAKEPLRLDASSDESAQASWKIMVDTAPPKTRKKLLEAMLKINLAGAQSPTDKAADPGPQGLGITRIKDKVAGMTAKEIIEYGDRVSTVKIVSPPAGRQ